jgi:dephospho-CoA kinase
MNVIGLTGGIASGKSTVGRWLRAAGVAVVDADQVARDVVVPGTPALAALVDRFGAAILAPTGELNRGALGAVVFHDDTARAALNGILHPAIAQEAATQLAAVAATGALEAVYEVPLLLENNLEHNFFATVLVAVDEEEQIKRVVQRDGLDVAAARARLAAQMPIAEKRRRAQHVIENDADLATLAQRASAVFSTVLGRPITLGA